MNCFFLRCSCSVCCGTPPGGGLSTSSPPRRCVSTRQTQSSHAGIPLPASHTARGHQQDVQPRDSTAARSERPISYHHSYSDLIKLSKLQGSISVDGRPDVLAVVAALHRLQLPHAADVGQPRLDLRHVQHLQKNTPEHQ